MSSIRSFSAGILAVAISGCAGSASLPLRSGSGSVSQVPYAVDSGAQRAARACVVPGATYRSGISYVTVPKVNRAIFGVTLGYSTIYFNYKKGGPVPTIPRYVGALRGCQTNNTPVGKITDFNLYESGTECTADKCRAFLRIRWYFEAKPAVDFKYDEVIAVPQTKGFGPLPLALVWVKKKF